MNIKRGDIFYADLSPVVGSEQGGIRPVLIVQNNVGNRFSPTVIAAAITSQKSKANLPTHIQLRANDSGLSRDSVVLLEQIRTLDKRRLKEKMGTLNPYSMHQVDEALSISFGLCDGRTMKIFERLHKPLSTRIDRKLFSPCATINSTGGNCL